MSDRGKNIYVNGADEPKRDEQFNHMENMLNITNELATYETLEEMLRALVGMVAEQTDAERGSLFLHDDRANELYTTVAHGNLKREIRIMDSTGVAGFVYNSGQSVITHDAYKDNNFDRSSDEITGFVTKNLLATPIKTVNGKIIGVIEALNKKNGKFSDEDKAHLEAIGTQAAIFLQATQYVENMKKTRAQELEFLDIVSDITSEIDLSALLQKVMSEAARMLMADRTTLFLNDEKTNELWSELGVGLESSQIRFPNDRGIGGTVFQTGEAINIPHAYADLRFNPDFDKATGYFTHSILCVPVVNKNGKTIGVTQALNKSGGPFSKEDESRLRAFTAQVSIALENAKLFNDVQNMKNYNDSMLESMSNGVITFNGEDKIVTCNAAGLSILGLSSDEIINKNANELFLEDASWIVEKIDRVKEKQEQDMFMDVVMTVNGQSFTSNITILPLKSPEDSNLGSMIMIEDITSEKRMKSTMSRYMDPVIADKLLDAGEDVLGGVSAQATILFSDIRGFTTLTEELGPQGTVSLLNEYFTIMVDCIQQEGGMLDKFIGDAIMAAFGVPVSHDDDEDRAVRTGISMIKRLFDWNKERAAHGKKPVDMGLGLNTDMVVSGNIGAPRRMDYTMIGDGVNLAARLESACKKYSARILISENTYAKLRGVYRIRDIDKVIVKGKTEPVGVYEVLDYYSDNDFPNLMEVLGYFNEGVSYYRGAQWEKATSSFTKALGLHSGDKLCQMYLDRCEHMKVNPPGDDWDGVWVMDSK